MLFTASSLLLKGETGLSSSDIGKLHNLPSTSPAALLRLAHLILNNSFYRLKHDFSVNTANYNVLTNYGKIDPRPTLAALVILWRKFALPFVDSQESQTFDSESYLDFLKILQTERLEAQEALSTLLTFASIDSNSNEQAYLMYRSRWTPQLTKPNFELLNNIP